jgi:hypothetical protein
MTASTSRRTSSSGNPTARTSRDATSSGIPTRATRCEAGARYRSELRVRQDQKRRPRVFTGWRRRRSAANESRRRRSRSRSWWQRL